MQNTFRVNIFKSLGHLYNYTTRFFFWKLSFLHNILIQISMTSVLQKHEKFLFESNKFLKSDYIRVEQLFVIFYFFFHMFVLSAAQNGQVYLREVLD
jgi:hypothetical protein